VWVKRINSGVVAYHPRAGNAHLTFHSKGRKGSRLLPAVIHIKVGDDKVAQIIWDDAFWEFKLEPTVPLGDNLKQACLDLARVVKGMRNHVMAVELKTMRRNRMVFKVRREDHRPVICIRTPVRRIIPLGKQMPPH
jgi:hypothetical protein